MQHFNKNSLVMRFVRLVLELDMYKKENRKLRSENETLRQLIQTKQAFEARV